MLKFVIMEKAVGETPLVVAENWRAKNPEYKDVPLAYAGRLDPMASGQLLILIGDECKNQALYHNLDKEYQFEVLFGVGSDSGDVLGMINEAGEKTFSPEKIAEILPSLIGPIELPYPIFSSKTVEGKPLHTWTMEGRLNEITIPTRRSEIFSLALLETRELTRAEVAKIALEKIETIPPVTDLRKALGNDFRRSEIRPVWQAFSEQKNPTDCFTIAKIYCHASSGTYMRTLAEVIAQKLDTKGLAFSIHRSRIFLPDDFSENN